MGQSSGWFTSRNSITARCASRTKGVRVCTFIPSATGVAQAGTGLPTFSTCTRHIRQFAATESFLW